MLVYNILIVFFVFGYGISNLKDYNKFSQSLKIMTLTIFFYIPATIIMSFRYKVGTDYSTYENIFHLIKDDVTNNTVLNLEFGYFHLNKLLSNITDNPQSIFIVTSFIIMSFYFLGILKRSEDEILSFFLFLGLSYYFNSMNGLRQFIAVSIIFFGTHYLENNNDWKFICSVAVAALFHKTALVMIIFYIALKFLKGNSFYWVTGLVSVFLFLNTNFIYKILLKFNIYPE